MKKLIFGIISLVVLVSIFSIASFAVAAQENSEVGGDSLELPSNETAVPSGLGRAYERISLLLTLDKAKKAEKELEYAQRRLLEVRTMIEQKRFDQAEKSKLRYEVQIERAKSRVDKLKDDKNPEKELENRAKFEAKLSKHEGDLERLETEFELKINGNLTDEQKQAIDNLIAAFKNQTGSLRLRLELGENENRVRLKAKLKSDDNETDDLINKAKEKFNVTSGYVRASEAAIDRASKVISLAETRLEEAKASNRSKLNLDKADELLSEAKSLLEEAKNASANSEYQKSIALANKATSRVLRFVNANLTEDEKKFEKAVERAEKAIEKLEELKDRVAEKRAELAKKRSANESSDDNSDDSEDLDSDSDSESDDSSEYKDNETA